MSDRLRGVVRWARGFPARHPKFGTVFLVGLITVPGYWVLADTVIDQREQTDQLKEIVVDLRDQQDRLGRVIAGQQADRTVAERRQCESSNTAREGIVGAFTVLFAAFEGLVMSDEGRETISRLRAAVFDDLPRPDRDCNDDGVVNDQDFAE